jgi:hypothetical protein
MTTPHPGPAKMPHSPSTVANPSADTTTTVLSIKDSAVIETKIEPPYRTHWLTWFFAALVLIPTILGFANKFLDLVLVVQGDEEGAFAITPIMNYLFATAGFLCLLLWTASRGAFQDLDRPSRTMFENEQRLDAMGDFSRTSPASEGP